MLDVKHVSVAFGGVKALQDVTFTVEEGAVHALIGPNGAGKTTMFNAVTGFVTPDAGSVGFGGKDITANPPHKVFAAGIARTFQNLNIISELTLRENLMLGLVGRDRPSVPLSLLRLNRKYWNEADERIREALAFTRIEKYADETPGNLPYGVLKNAELARALLSRPKLLLLDEPAAGLHSAEKDALSDMVLKLKDEGITVLMVEHDMHFIGNLAEHVVCLNFGSVIATGTYADIRENEAVIEAYLGVDDD